MDYERLRQYERTCNLYQGSGGAPFTSVAKVDEPGVFGRMYLFFMNVLVILWKKEGDDE